MDSSWSPTRICIRAYSVMGPYWFRVPSAFLTGVISSVGQVGIWYLSTNILLITETVLPQSSNPLTEYSSRVSSHSNTRETSIFMNVGPLTSPKWSGLDVWASTPSPCLLSFGLGLRPSLLVSIPRWRLGSVALRVCAWWELPLGFPVLALDSVVLVAFEVTYIRSSSARICRN